MNDEPDYRNKAHFHPTTLAMRQLWHLSIVAVVN